MFLVSLNRELRSIDWFTKNNIKEPDLIGFLDLVSLGTVCDVVPLIGLNRAIVKQGLKVIGSVINIANIPTSASGLSTGDIYSNSGVLTIV